MTPQTIPAAPVAAEERENPFLAALLKAEQDAHITQWDGKGGQQQDQPLPHIDPWAINFYR